jgi:hypothetical protein
MAKFPLNMQPVEPGWYFARYGKLVARKVEFVWVDYHEGELVAVLAGSETIFKLSEFRWYGKIAIDEAEFV